MSLKEVFFRRLAAKFYSYLRSGPLRDWDTSQRSDFAGAVVRQNKAKIDKYLEEKKVTLHNINQCIDEIIEKVLIPSIEIK